MAVIEHLFVEQFGAFIGKTSERLVVSVRGERIAQAPLLYLQAVTIASDGFSQLGSAGIAFGMNRHPSDAASTGRSLAAQLGRSTPAATELRKSRIDARI
jgi:hypothetical protein